MAVSPDPIRTLQAAARSMAEAINSGEAAGRVIVLGITGRKLFDGAVPTGETPSAGAGVEKDHPGWLVTDRQAQFDGQPVPVRGRNLDVLRLLVAGDVVTVDELRAAWEGYKAEESTIRWQIGELRKVLKKHFPDYPAELVESTGAGYKLTLR